MFGAGLAFNDITLFHVHRLLAALLDMSHHRLLSSLPSLGPIVGFTSILV